MPKTEKHAVRVEIVRDRTARQPWRARLLSNGRIIACTSEAYTQKVGVVRALAICGWAELPRTEVDATGKPPKAKVAKP